MSKLSATVTLRDTIRLMLEDDERRFDAEERAAKEKWESTQASLKAWDEANQAYLASIEKWQQDVKAKKAKVADKPAKPDLLKKFSSRDKLEREFKKAQGEYAVYEPGVIGYRRERQNKAEDPGQLPDSKKKAFVKLSAIKPMRWYSWPTSSLSRSKLKGGFGEERRQGVGPGEDWLAYILGGQVQGGGTSFDLVMPDGSKWEVKGLEDKTSTFRTGTEGLKAAGDTRLRLHDIMRQLKTFAALVTKTGISDQLPPEPRAMLEHVVAFTEDEYDAIVNAGEISRERIKGFRAALRAASRLKAYKGEGKKSDKKDTRTDVALNDKKMQVSKPAFIDIANRVERDVQKQHPEEKIEVLSEFEEFEIVKAALKDDAFEDPDGYLDDFYKSVNVEQAFEQVDGLFIVNSRGFIKLPKPLMSKYLRLESMTMGGRPVFTFAGWGSGPDGAPAPGTMK